MAFRFNPVLRTIGFTTDSAMPECEMGQENRLKPTGTRLAGLATGGRANDWTRARRGRLQQRQELESSAALSPPNVQTRSAQIEISSFGKGGLLVAQGRGRL